MISLDKSTIFCQNIFFSAHMKKELKKLYISTLFLSKTLIKIISVYFMFHFTVITNDIEKMASSTSLRCQLLHLVQTMVQESRENQRSNTPRNLQQHSAQNKFETFSAINSSIFRRLSSIFAFLSSTD